MSAIQEKRDSGKSSDQTSRRGLLTGATVGLAAATVAANGLSSAQAQTTSLSAEHQAALEKLNKSLDDSKNYQEFVADPSAYASKFDVKIDPNLGKQVSSALKDTKSLAEIKPALNKNAPSPATALVCALGACAPTDTKIAIVI
jgi:hypothetical protein